MKTPDEQKEFLQKLRIAASEADELLTSCDASDLLDGLEVSRDFMFEAACLIEQYMDRNNRLNDHLLEKEAYIERLHRRGNVAQFAYEPGELVFAPAKLFDRRSTHFDFKVIDDPDRPVPARVTACVYGIDDTRYEIKALDKNQRMQGMRIVVSAQHLIRAENMLKGAYGK